MCVCVRVTSRHIISLSPCPLFTADQRMTTGLNAVLEKWKRPRQPNQFALQNRRWIKPVNSRKHWREKSTTILLWEEHQQIFTVPVLRSSKQMQIWPQSPQCRSRGHIPQRNRCPGKGTFWQPVLQPGRGRAADLAAGPFSPPAPKSGSTASKEPGSGADRPYPENPPTTTGCVCHEPHRQPRPARGLKIRWAGAFGDFDCTASVHTQPGLKAETHQPLSQPCRGGRSPPDSQPGARGTVS